MNLMLVFLLLFNSIPLAKAKTSVWAGFRGAGESNTEVSGLPLEWSDNKNIAWNIALPGYGRSSPVIRQNKIFLTAIQWTNKEKLLITCFDLKSGRELWRREPAATFTMKDSGTVSKAAPTPAVDEKRVYVFFESGELLAFDHKGNLQWQRRLADEYGGYKTNHGLGSSLAMTDKAVTLLVVHSGPSYLLAVDKQTGRNLWKTDRTSGGGWSTPTVITSQNKQQILISVSGGVTAYDAIAGAQICTVGGLIGNNIPSHSVDLEQISLRR